MSPDNAPEDKSYRLPEAIRKNCELYRLLAGYEVTGLAPGEIAKALKVQPSWVSQNLPPLAQLGFVERVGDIKGTRWRLGVALVRIAHTVLKAHEEANRASKERLDRICTAL